MTLSEFFQKYNTILIHDIAWVKDSLGLTFTEFDQQLDELIESGEVEKRNYGNFGLQCWGTPQNLKPTQDQLDRLMEVINEMDYFTPTSLYSQQFMKVRLNKISLAAAIQTLYDAGRIQNHEEKRAGNTVYQTYSSTERITGEEAVYSYIRDNGPVSKSAVAKGTGLSRFVCDKRIDQMIKDKSIRRIGDKYAIQD